MQDTMHNSSHVSAQCDHMVFSCIDNRFRVMVANWIRDNLNDKADLVAWAGAAKEFNDEDTRDRMLGQVRIGQDLHGVKTVHLMDHFDCGAFGGSAKHESPRAEMMFHRRQLEKAGRVIEKASPGTEVKLYVLTFDGVVPMEQFEEAMAA